MTNHLTVTTKAPGGASSSRAFNAPAAEAETGALGAFAAMLDGSEPEAAGTTSGKTTLDTALNQLAGLLLGDAAGDEADSEAQDPEALAAAIDAALPITSQPDPKTLFAGLVNDLAALKQALAAGEAPDAELLKRVDSALGDLAEQLDIDLAALATPTLADLARLAQAASTDDASTTARLAEALAASAETLLTGATVSTTTEAESDAAQLLQSIGDKLARLAQALNSNAIDAGNLASLNLEADGAANAELEAALSKLLATTATQDKATTEPTLGTASLSLTETVVIGKTAEAGASTSALADAADARDMTTVLDADAKPDTGSDAKSDSDAKPSADNDNKAIDPKAGAAVAVAIAEVHNEAQGTAQNAVQAARADAAAPRLVQAGYQTSQQQLNLPQLAFELVRQVNDGNTRFQMRLDPPELGRIDVKLDIDTSGQVSARLVVEKSETLDLMQRDQKALERALQQAGLDASKTSLEFSLKQSPFSGGQQQARDDQGQAFGFSGNQSSEAEEAPPTINLYRASLTASGVNIIA